MHIASPSCRPATRAAGTWRTGNVWLFREAALLRFPRIDVQNVEGVLELVHYFHPPFPIRLEFAVQTLQYLTGCDGCFLPSGMLVRQFLAIVVEFVALVVDVEKYRGMKGKQQSCSLFHLNAAYFGGCNAGELAQSSEWEPVTASRAFLSRASRSGPGAS